MGIVHSCTLRVNETTFTPAQRAGKHWNYSGFCMQTTEFDPQDSALTIFSVPSILPTWGTPTLKPNVTKHNIYNSNEFRFTPRDGMIIVFPGHTQHGVSKNLLNQNRYCISFDYFLAGSVCTENTSVLTL